MYGKTPRTFAEEWKISESAAQRIYDAILGQFSTYREWTRDCLARARRTGCVWTWWDGSLARRRFLHALDDPDSLVRSRAEHGSWNTPIQGTASEFCTRSVVECVRWIAEGDIPARVVLTVHDQIVLEVDEEILDEAAFTVRGIMQGWNSGDVPLVVDVDVGRSWGSLKRYKEERSDEGSREGEVARP
jgi:DNA polymerase-1